MELSNISVIKNILEKYHFSFSKSMGQNFLINPSVCPRMAQLSGIDKTCGVIEVGPGIGVLTRELAKAAKKVVAVELDSRLIPVLGTTLEGLDNVKVIQGDILKTDLHRLMEEEFGGMPVYVCANLPYYITTPILMYLLESRAPLTAVTVMVQKEMARRICAPVGTRECGAVTAAIHYYALPKVLFDVSRGSFLPAPNVDSSVIQLTLREQPPVALREEKMLFQVIKGAFSQRRKTLLNCLSAFFSMDKGEVSSLLEKAGVPATKRAEELSLQQFADIANQIAAAR